MKRLALILIATLAFAASAQVYLLPDFKLCIATQKKDMPIRDNFNYNCSTQRMEFKDGDSKMELSPIDQIDTLYLSGHKMVPYNSRFLEVYYRSQEFNLYIDHKIRPVDAGKVGAMGIKTHATGVYQVDMVGISETQSNKDYRKISIDAVNYKNETSYLLEINKKRKKFSDKKSLLKLLPEKQEAIDTYLAAQSVDFRDAEAVLALLKAALQ